MKEIGQSLYVVLQRKKISYLNQLPRSLLVFREKRNIIPGKFPGDKINGPIYENDSDPIPSENYKICYNENCRKQTML